MYFLRRIWIPVFLMFAGMVADAAWASSRSILIRFTRLMAFALDSSTTAIRSGIPVISPQHSPAPLNVGPSGKTADRFFMSTWYQIILFIAKALAKSPVLRVLSGCFFYYRCFCVDGLWSLLAYSYPKPNAKLRESSGNPLKPMCPFGRLPNGRIKLRILQKLRLFFADILSGRHAVVVPELLAEVGRRESYCLGNGG